MYLLSSVCCLAQGSKLIMPAQMWKKGQSLHEGQQVQPSYVSAQGVETPRGAAKVRARHSSSVGMCLTRHALTTPSLADLLLSTAGMEAHTVLTQQPGCRNTTIDTYFTAGRCYSQFTAGYKATGSSCAAERPEQVVLLGSYHALLLTDRTDQCFGAVDNPE